MKKHNFLAFFQIWVVLLIGWNKFPRWHDQSETLPRSRKWLVISLEFLRSFLRRHFEVKRVVVSRNVRCFLGLLIGWSKFLKRHDQSELLSRSRKWRVISIEFLRSFLRLHLAGKPVAKCPLFSRARHLNRPRNHKQIILAARSWVLLNLIRFYLSTSITLQKNPGVYGFLSFLVTII